MRGSAAFRTRWQSVLAWLDVRFRSPAAIYGVIVFTAFVSIAEDDSESLEDMLAQSLGSLLIFFIAHVFAHTLTDHADHGLRAATRRALRHGSGMLYASVPPIIVFAILAVSGGSLSNAVDYCQLTAFAVLAVLGYQAFHRRGAGIVLRLLGALATALLGFFIVILESGFH